MPSGHSIRGTLKPVLCFFIHYGRLVDLVCTIRNADKPFFPPDAEKSRGFMQIACVNSFPYYMYKEKITHFRKSLRLLLNIRRKKKYNIQYV